MSLFNAPRDSAIQLAQGDALAQEIGSSALPTSELRRLHESIRPGLTIEYLALVPRTIDQTRVAIIFPPGSQSEQAALYCINQWRDDFRNTGWLVISPIAPMDRLFFNLEDQEIRAFIENLQARFQLQDCKMHLFGSSNGGVSAFRAATVAPNYFQSLTAMPGFPHAEDKTKLKLLRPLKINFITGEHDALFLKRATKAFHKLKSIGADVQFDVIVGEGHNVQHLVNFERLTSGLPAGSKEAK